MSDQTHCDEIYVERKVTYTMEMDGKFILIRNVPARVNVDTGETLYAPETVERIQELVLHGQQPKRTIKTLVYEY